MKKDASLLKNLFTKDRTIVLSPSRLLAHILAILTIFIATPALAANYGYAADRLLQSGAAPLGETFASSLEINMLDSKQSEKPDWGLEIDALPYITGGYYGSSWLGWRNFRLRGVISRVKLPEFVLPKDFSAWEIDVLAVIFDFFPRATGKYQGPWLGAGYEYWESAITVKGPKRTGATAHHILTLGGGYVHKFSGHLYVNLWGAGHYTLSGTELQVNGESYKIPPFQGEVSLKLGWIF